MQVSTSRPATGVSVMWCSPVDDLTIMIEVYTQLNKLNYRTQFIMANQTHSVDENYFHQSYVIRSNHEVMEHEQLGATWIHQ